MDIYLCVPMDITEGKKTVNTNAGDIHKEYPYYSVYLNEIAEGPSSVACCA